MCNIPDVDLTPLRRFVSMSDVLFSLLSWRAMEDCLRTDCSCVVLSHRSCRHPIGCRGDGCAGKANSLTKDRVVYSRFARRFHFAD